MSSTSSGRITTRPWPFLHGEPPLREVLADPVVHAVMRRDGVSFGHLLNVIAAAQARLRRGLCRCAAVLSLGKKA